MITHGLLGPRLITRDLRSGAAVDAADLLFRGLTGPRLITRGFGEASSTAATMFIVATVSSYSGFVEPGFTQVSNL